MSMTQMVFLKSDEMPTKGQIQTRIQELGFDFFISGEPGQSIDQDGLLCAINGQQTFFETYVENADLAISNFETDWLKHEVAGKDVAISFVWSVDFAAGACIGLICVALIDLSNAHVYYMDDQMKYTRSMLLEETPDFLAAMPNETEDSVKGFESHEPDQQERKSPTGFWSRIKRFFK